MFPTNMPAGSELAGRAYLKNKSQRGHWDSQHVEFPSHPVTRGVTPWKVNDGLAERDPNLWTRSKGSPDGLVRARNTKKAGPGSIQDRGLDLWIVRRGSIIRLYGADAHSAQGSARGCGS